MRPLTSRLFGLLAATIVGLFAPSLSVLHGVAHAQSAGVFAEGPHEHQADAHPDVHLGSASATAPTLHEHDAPDDHDHPTVAIGVSGRAFSLDALATEISPLVIAPVVQQSEVRVSRDVTPFLADARAVRPSQPRAPPLG